MAPKLNDLCQSLNQSAVYFEQTACQVLDLFDKNSNDLLNGILFSQKVPYYDDLDCITLATQGSCLVFISVPSVQNMLTTVWNGELDYEPALKAKLKVYIVTKLILIKI